MSRNPWPQPDTREWQRISLLFFFPTLSAHRSIVGAESDFANGVNQSNLLSVDKPTIASFRGSNAGNKCVLTFSSAGNSRRGRVKSHPLKMKKKLSSPFKQGRNQLIVSGRGNDCILSLYYFRRGKMIATCCCTGCPHPLRCGPAFHIQTFPSSAD